MVYIHIPFCRSFCTYCDFYSELCPGEGKQEVQNALFSSFLANVLVEMERRIPYSASGPFRDGSGEDGCVSAPDTIYFGGGTPSVLPLDIVEKIVSALRMRGVTGRDEFTFEVNPDDVVKGGRDYVRSLLGLGVSRVSMGVQSFDDGILRWMNRRHSAHDAVEAVRILREEGLKNLSVDLIFGLSQLSESVWSDTIEKALALHPEHISAYQLSIEEGSALGRMAASGQYLEASDELCRRQYDALCSRLASAGYSHYEISNWALPGNEAVHNSAYWRRHPYTGLGPGAHSFSIVPPSADNATSSAVRVPSPDSAASAGPVLSASTRVPAGKLLQIRSWNSEAICGYESSSEILSEEEAVTETIMLALRTSEGISASFLREHSDSVDELLAEGALVAVSVSPSDKSSPSSFSSPLQVSSERLRIPEDRFFVSDDIISRLL